MDDIDDMKEDMRDAGSALVFVELVAAPPLAKEVGGRAPCSSSVLVSESSSSSSSSSSVASVKLASLSSCDSSPSSPSPSASRTLSTAPADEVWRFLLDGLAAALVAIEPEGVMKAVVLLLLLAVAGIRTEIEADDVSTSESISAVVAVELRRRPWAEFSRGSWRMARRLRLLLLLLVSFDCVGGSKLGGAGALCVADADADVDVPTPGSEGGPSADGSA